MNPAMKAIEEKRLIFFKGGKYKYIPTTETQKKIGDSKKIFDSKKAEKMYEAKIHFRNHIWKETDRRLEKIEKWVDKGLIKISNKEFILK